MEGKNMMFSWYRIAATLCAFLGIGLLFVGSTDAQTGSVVINEVMGDNKSTIADGDGDFPDWIELYNPTGADVDLAGWIIGDASAAWQVPADDPDTVIAAGGYKLIWASDKGDPTDADFPGPSDELHANFKISSTNGDTITLFNPSGESQQVVVPGMEPDETYSSSALGVFGLLPAGSGTPNAENGTAPSTPTVTPTPSPTPLPQAGPASIVIYELMASNATSVADGDGDFEDWFELYNPTCEAVDIGGWSVADSAESWTIPADTVMNSGDVLVLWASNKGDETNGDFPGPNGELHTNFKLSATAAEGVVLVNAAGLLIDSITPAVLSADESWGLSGDTARRFGVTELTFGQLNPGDTAPVCTPTVTATATPTVAAATPTPTATVVAPTVTPTATVTPEVLVPTPTATVVAPTVTPTATATVVAPTVTPTATPSTIVPCSTKLVINEIAPRGTAFADGDGDTSDWLEIFNPAATAVDLTGWTIEDSSAVWDFPTGTIAPPNGFLIVWASDKGDPDDGDFPGPAGELHTNFKLSGGGEAIGLADSTGCEVERVSYPDLDDGQTFGVSDGALRVFMPGLDTPGAVNGPTRMPTRAVCVAPGQPIRIDRVVAKNDSLRADVEGDFSDYIEIYNEGFDPYSVSSWIIRDDRDYWEIPWGTNIEGYSSITVWASGKGEDYDQYPGPEGELHAPFKLSSDGETLTLLTVDDCIVDELIYPELGSDQAYGYNGAFEPEIFSPVAAAQPCAAPGSARITAVQAKNASTRSDEDGEFGDWITLGNTTDEVIDLSGWLLADSSNSWIIPDGSTMAVDGDLLVWADEKDRGGDGAALHTNFKLGGDGETISLQSSVACPVDEVTYPPLDDDQQYALGADGTYAVVGQAEQADNKNNADTTVSVGDVTVTATCLAISEVMAKNDSTIDDDDGEFGDWIELVNLGDVPIDLTGFTIADADTSWAIPDQVEIAAGGFLLIWADEVDRGTADSELHANFKLGGNGEPVTVRSADGSVAASLSTYPELDDDESFGVNADGNYVVNAAGSATPGAEPAPRGGCDFEIAAGTANPRYEAGDVAQTSAGGSGATAGAEVLSSTGSSGSSGDLAYTGQSYSLRTLAAQLLIAVGAALVAMEHIMGRRQRAH